MTPHYADDWLTVYHGDSRAVMAEMEPESVHCVVTSPPYWGLRDYGDAGQLGLEPTPEEYVANMVAVFREVRRVLRSDGTVWLNLGDSYAGSGKGAWSDNETREANRGRVKETYVPTRAESPTAGVVPPGLKPKDLVGIPWRVAFALQADGWYLRSDIIWSKPNPMPSPVTDRPTKSHEYLFLLSKSPRYYFDADAVREDQEPASLARYAYGFNKTGKGLDLPGGASHSKGNGADGGQIDPNPSGRNIRSVWTIATAPYPGAHFATFPPKLVEPCIKAGTSERGVCPECGRPWVREVEREPVPRDVFPSSTNRRPVTAVNDAATANGGMSNGTPNVITIGWRPPDCNHRDAYTGLHAVPVPATVLDPFAGSGTTGMVAQSLSRRAVLIDLSMDYLDQLMERNRHIPLGLGA